MKTLLRLTTVFAVTCLAAPVLAQEAQPAAPPAVPVDAPAAAPAAVPAAPTCELHVWPTENYLGWNSGLLSGFGVVGVVSDMAAHADKVKTVKVLMREFLGPEIQIEELNKIGITEALKLKGYTVIIEEPTPFNEDLKKDPELKAKTKALNARLKAKKRLTSSTNPCYAELVGTVIFYHKAMMYGSNLFGGWIYREFKNGPLATKTVTGMVKNPLEDFPPKTSDKINPAKAELRDAYAKDFSEYVAKKVMGSTATK